VSVREKGVFSHLASMTNPAYACYSTGEVGRWEAPLCRLDLVTSVALCRKNALADAYTYIEENNDKTRSRFSQLSFLICGPGSVLANHRSASLETFGTRQTNVVAQGTV
jgi:hypothetical protein